MIKITVKLATGQIIEEVVSKDVAILGRSQKSDVVIADEALSRSHCQVDYDGENFFITDLASANGVSIDGKKIEPNKKIKFSSFEEVLLGPHEVSVEFEEEVQTPSPSKTPIKTNSRPTPSKPTPSKVVNVKKETKKKFPLVNLFAFLVVAGAIFYQVKVKEPANPPVLDATSVNTPAGVTLPDSFLTSAEYIAKDELKTCTDANELTCKELSLNKESGEGVLIEGQQAFLFIRPFGHLGEPKFEKIKELEDKEKLIGIYLALKSHVFESFRKKEILQVHLILKNEQARPYRVYRFHTKYYTLNGPEKARLITELITIFEGAAPAPFWTEASTIIQSQDL
jgi:pSer/pThr/pTyr-binding forkhead associated (FHA) protein